MVIGNSFSREVFPVTVLLFSHLPPYMKPPNEPAILGVHAFREMERNR